MRLLAGIGLGLLVVWLALLAALALARPQGAAVTDAARLLPDLVALVRRLAADPEVPRRSRIALWLLVAYLLVPIDLVPDFVPLLGYADDAIVVALALRRVVRAAGEAAIARNWRGSEAGMTVVRRLAPGSAHGGGSG